MFQKHPQARPAVGQPGLLPPPAKVSHILVQHAVKSFSNGSVPGPSGLRPSHLQEALNCPSPDLAGSFLSAFVFCKLFSIW